MAMTLELPADIEQAISLEAQRRGTTPEEQALETLRLAYASAPAQDYPKTGAELLAIMHRDNLFVPRREGDPDSPERARQIREEAQRPREHLWNRP